MNDVTGPIIVAVGPSLTDADKSRYPGISFRSPVAEGDLLRFCTEQPVAIGLVDGFWGDKTAVLHKEILWAMASGIPVYGAGSIGALRAAELDGYGMVGVGDIYRAYRSGRLTDDGDVALLHGPAALRYRPLTVAYVDVEATVASLQARQRIAGEVVEDVLAAARGLHFGVRTWEAIAADAETPLMPKATLLRELKEGQVEKQRLDALELLQRMTTEPLLAPVTGYWPPQTTSFQSAVERALPPFTE